MSAEELSWVDSWDLLVLSGVKNLNKYGQEATFSCFSGNHAHGDSSPSAGMNLTNSLWRCRTPSCGLKGNAIDFVASLKQIDRDAAERYLRSRYGSEVDEEDNSLTERLQRLTEPPTSSEPERHMISQDEYEERFRDSRHYVGYMLNRGFDWPTMNEWKLGYDQLSRRMTIPVYDESSNLVGIKARAIVESQGPRYISLGDPIGRPQRYGFDTYMKSHYVYGLDRAQSTTNIVLVEGELNVIALAQMGIEAVAIAGSEFSDEQRRLIVAKFREVKIYFDWDPAGITAMKGVAGLLRPYVPVEVLRFAPGDAADALDPKHKFAPRDLKHLLERAEPWLHVANQQTMMRTSEDDAEQASALINRKEMS